MSSRTSVPTPSNGSHASQGKATKESLESAMGVVAPIICIKIAAGMEVRAWKDPHAQWKLSGPGTRAVIAQHQASDTEQNPLDLLYSSDSDNQSTRLVNVQDRGSCPKHARVAILGEPCRGITDTGQTSPLLEVTC